GPITRWPDYLFIGDLGLLGKDFVDAHHGCGSALENIDDPSERDDRPGELHHVSVEGDEIADRHLSEEDLSSAEPQHDDNGSAEHEFQCGPEHSHQADQAKAAAYVFPVGALEGGDLGLFLHIGADDAGARKIFLGAGRDVGEHGLNAFEALVNAAAEILYDDAGNGQRQKSVEGQLGADGEHEAESAGGEDDGVGRVHDGGAEQHPDRVQVVGGAGHNVARAVALVVGVGEALKVREQVVAQIEFDIARDSDDHPARQKLEDSLDQSDGDDKQGVGEKLLAGDPGVQIVDGAAENLRKQYPDSVIE